MPAGGGDRVAEVRAAAQGEPARGLHVAQHEHVHAALLLHGERDDRVLQKLLQLARQRVARFGGAHPADHDALDQRVLDRTVGLHDRVLREVGMAVHRDRELVARHGSSPRSSTAATARPRARRGTVAAGSVGVVACASGASGAAASRSAAAPATSARSRWVERTVMTIPRNRTGRGGAGARSRWSSRRRCSGPLRTTKYTT